MIHVIKKTALQREKILSLVSALPVYSSLPRNSIQCFLCYSLIVFYLPSPLILYDPFCAIDFIIVLEANSNCSGYWIIRTITTSSSIYRERWRKMVIHNLFFLLRSVYSILFSLWCKLGVWFYSISTVEKADIKNNIFFYFQSTMK